MTVLRVRGRALPDGEFVGLYADGDRWTTDPVRGSGLVAEGWLLPGLEPGALADAVVYAADPRTDLHQLDHPLVVILRGRRVA